MRLVAALTLLFSISALTASAGPVIPPYHSQNDFLLTSPGGMGFGLYGYANPALLKYVERPDILFTWSDASGEWNDFDRWGLFAGLPTPNMGFGMIRNKDSLGAVTDYRLSLAFGDRSSSFGVGYGWSAGSISEYNRGRVLTVGSLTRPIPHLSVGLTGAFATAGSAKEGVFDLAVRPLGNEVVAVFGDYAIQNGEKPKDGHWSTGAALELLPGIRLTGRYFDTHGFSLGLNFSLGDMGLASQAHFDDERVHGYNTYGVRLGAMDRNVLTPLMNRRHRYVDLQLTGLTKYQRYKMFDKSNTLAGLLSAIDGAKEDETVAGIAINTSDMRFASIEMAWEVREKLRDFKSAGKHVVVFVDDAGLYAYHFASVADKIVMDPTGEIALPGMRLGRTYLKGTLEKLGIGFDEWRFFKYKSAYEGFARDSMSEGDEEQILAILEDFYGQMRAEISEGRGIAPEEFDRMVNENLFFMPEEALEAGLVDTLGRWEAVKKTIETLEGDAKGMMGPGGIAKYRLPHDDYWGKRPQVALIYALGVCAMDQGIKARSLSKVIDGVAGNNNIKAVVFRVDSPGGSATASDVVADALMKCSEKKPVIVSQGMVAGSGGYWISMYGDTIVASPLTVTGSIGVIGGWFYNKGIKEKLGMATDVVKIGEHADLGFGISLPLLGQVPDRNLTADERSKVEHSIKTFYKHFVEKVAKGRHMEYDEIHEVGQGRVWSGSAGLKNGLIDELGGLETAIKIAKAKAGIAADEKIDIVEMPEVPLFDPNIFMPKLFGIKYEKNELIEHIKFRMEHNGEPMPLMPIEQMDYLSGYTEAGS
ncbi:MAG: signal peptide peptidase SppA [Candidatus Eisenbacteria bacterium]